MIKFKRGFFGLILTFFFITSLGCGYTTGSLLPSHLKSIYVDNFKNKIDVSKEVTEMSRYTLYRPGLENDVTSAIVERFVFDGNLKIEKEKNANLILRGNLVDYRQEALRYDRDDDVEEYRIKVVVDIELIETATDKALWTQRGMEGRSTYRISGPFATSKDAAREEAIEELARYVVERTVEDW
jgi:hypothetical protein